MKTLPPYGKTINQSDRTIFVYAGYRSQVFTHFKNNPTNSCAIFLWQDPQTYYWPVSGRDIILVCWLLPNDCYIEKLALTLLMNGAKKVGAVQIPTSNIEIYQGVTR